MASNCIKIYSICIYTVLASLTFNVAVRWNYERTHMYTNTYEHTWDSNIVFKRVWYTARIIWADILWGRIWHSIWTDVSAGKQQQPQILKRFEDIHMDGISPHRIVDCMTMWSKQWEKFTWRTAHLARMMLIIGLVRDKRRVHAYDIYLLKNWSPLKSFYFKCVLVVDSHIFFIFRHFNKILYWKSELSHAVTATTDR